MKENKKYIDMNKVIILLLGFIIILGATILINSVTKTNEVKATTNSKNVYADGNKVNNTDKEIVEEASKSAESEIESYELETIEYFENTENEIDNYIEENDKEKLSTIAKEKFVTLVDFIFYGTEINGVTFNQLSQTTKDKLVSIVNKIDNKIESKVPGYKEEISDDASKTYVFLSDKLKQGITYIDDKIEEKVGEEKYENFKSNVSETTDKVKETASNIIDNGKELAGNIKDKIKNWYEGWK